MNSQLIHWTRFNLDAAGLEDEDLLVGALRAADPLGSVHMGVTISLQEVIEAMELQFADAESFLDPDTGEIVTISDDDRSALDADPDSVPDWQREVLPKIRAVLESERCLRLPDSFDIDEWSIMQTFARRHVDDEARERLAGAVHGSGAFHRFREAIETLGLRDEWHAFRDSRVSEIARDWLESNGIRYE